MRAKERDAATVDGDGCRDTNSCPCRCGCVVGAETATFGSRSVRLYVYKFDRSPRRLGGEVHGFAVNEAGGRVRLVFGRPSDVILRCAWLEAVPRTASLLQRLASLRRPVTPGGAEETIVRVEEDLDALSARPRGWTAGPGSDVPPLGLCAIYLSDGATSVVDPALAREVHLSFGFSDDPDGVETHVLSLARPTGSDARERRRVVRYEDATAMWSAAMRLVRLRDPCAIFGCALAHAFSMASRPGMEELRQCVRDLSKVEGLRPSIARCVRSLRLCVPGRLVLDARDVCSRGASEQFKHAMRMTLVDPWPGETALGAFRDADLALIGDAPEKASFELRLGVLLAVSGEAEGMDVAREDDDAGTREDDAVAAWMPIPYASLVG